MLHLCSTECCCVVKRASGLFVVKKRRRFKFDEVSQRFRLTSTEKRVALFVLAVFVLGLITKCYRYAHSSPTPFKTHRSSSRASAASRAKTKQPAALNFHEATRRPRKSAEKLDLSDLATKQGYPRK